MKNLYNAIRQKIQLDESIKYAVFDFDRTCLNNDIQELIYIHQAQHYAYRLPVNAFRELLQVSAHLDDNFAGIVEQVKTLEKEIDAINRQLNAKEHNHQISEEFFMKMLILLEIANQCCSHLFTYQWVLKFLEGYNKDEIMNMAHEVYENNLNQVLKPILKDKTQLTLFGVVPALCSGVSVNMQIVELMQFLNEQQVVIYILSASSVEAVAGVVSHTTYNNWIPMDRILAQHAELMIATGLLPVEEGKEQIIRRILMDRYEQQKPVVVAGDSMGDYWMMKMIETEGICVVVGQNEKLRRNLAAIEMPYFEMAY